MATMLSFIETNVDLPKSLLNKYLKICASLSFNSISVDGDMSTNDTVVFSSTGNIQLNMKNKSVESNFYHVHLTFLLDYPPHSQRWRRSD